MKKIMNNKKLMIIFVAGILFVAAGLVLIATGNNSSFLKNDNEEVDPTNPGNNQGDPNGKKEEISKSLVMNAIYEEKSLHYSNETWFVGDVAVIAHNDDDSKFLVHFRKVDGDSTDEMETILTIEDNDRYVDLPGWAVGSKDLSSYSFINYETDDLGYNPDNQQYSSDDPNNGGFAPQNTDYNNNNWNNIENPDTQNGSNNPNNNPNNNPDNQ